MKSRAIKAEVGEIVHIIARKRYFWGTDDKLPNKLLRAIQDSGTATSCVARLKAFITADGFEDKTSAALMVNPRQTANHLLASIAPSVGIFEGFALRVVYRMDGSIGAVYKIALKMIRPMDNGYWRYNPRMGERDYKIANDILIRPFIPGKIVDRISLIQQEIKEYGEQVGDLLVHFNPKEVDNGDIVPMPDCYSGLEDIESDAALQRQEKKNIKKGFKANTIIYIPGEIDDQTKDIETGKTDLDDLTENLKEFSKEDGAPIALIQGKYGKDGTPLITPYPVADILNGIDGARMRVPRAVCRHLNVPTPLVGFSDPTILGNSEAMSNALKIFTQTVTDRQRLIIEAFKMLWPEYEWKITKLNIIEFIPTEVLAKLTDNEIRRIAGYEPLEAQVDTSTKSLAQILGPDNMKAIMLLLADPLLSAQQKMDSLIVLFGVSESDARKLIFGNGNNN
jgi:hypothetical protein